MLLPKLMKNGHVTLETPNYNPDFVAKAKRLWRAPRSVAEALGLNSHPIEGGERPPAAATTPCMRARLHIAGALRPDDPIVLICDICDGVLVPRRDDVAPSCSTCRSPLCEHCRGKLEVARAQGSGAFVSERAARLTTPQRIKGLAALLGVVLEGLAGKPFRWGDGQRSVYVPQLRACGIDLVTRTMVERLGHRLKLRAEPVGKAYFGAPLQRTAELFVLGLQTVPREPKASRTPAPAPVPGAKP